MTTAVDCGSLNDLQVVAERVLPPDVDFAKGDFLLVSMFYFHFTAKGQLSRTFSRSALLMCRLLLQATVWSFSGWVFEVYLTLRFTVVMVQT